MSYSDDISEERVMRNDDGRVWITFFLCVTVLLVAGIAGCSYSWVQEIRAHTNAGHCQGTVPGSQSLAWVDCKTGKLAETPKP